MEGIKAAGRWGYWLAITLSGKLPAEPIPKLHWQHRNEHRISKVRANLEKCVHIAAEEHGFGGGAVRHLVEWLAWALGIQSPLVTESKLSPETQEKLYRTFDCALWIGAPGDHFGWLLAEYKGRGKDPSGFFPTPIDVCRVMVDFLFPEGQDNRLRSLLEPAIGTGAMALAAADHCLIIRGQDINPTCVLATLVQGGDLRAVGRLPATAYPGGAMPAARRLGIQGSLAAGKAAAQHRLQGTLGEQLAHPIGSAELHVVRVRGWSRIELDGESVAYVRERRFVEAVTEAIRAVAGESGGDGSR